MSKVGEYGGENAPPQGAHRILFEFRGLRTSFSSAKKHQGREFWRKIVFIYLNSPPSCSLPAQARLGPGSGLASPEWQLFGFLGILGH